MPAHSENSSNKGKPRVFCHRPGLRKNHGHINAIHYNQYLSNKYCFTKMYEDSGSNLVPCFTELCMEHLANLNQSRNTMLKKLIYTCVIQYQPVLKLPYRLNDLEKYKVYQLKMVKTCKSTNGCNENSMGYDTLL